MSTARLLIKYFWPHSINNYRPKLIHSSTLLLISFFLLLCHISLIYVLPKANLGVLGYASNIPSSEVVRLTNEKRVEAGLSPLNVDSELSAAAKAKGEHMLANGYWAHTAPDGTEPWVFFKNSGYNYRYAGENLARDFSNPQSAIEAWMASPTHKENLLSSKYQDIGIAVVEGNLGGVDTTLIVQLFGTKLSGAPAIAPVAQAKENTAPVLVEETKPTSVNLKKENVVLETPAPTPVQHIVQAPLGQASEAGSSSQVLISPFKTTRSLSLITIALLLIVLLVDAVVVSKARISRVSSKSFAHIAFLGMIFAIVLILKSGKIV